MHISRGVYNTYTNRNLRYSQVAPLDMFNEKKFVLDVQDVTFFLIMNYCFIINFFFKIKSTGTNLPAQIDIYSKKGNTYDFLYVAKGGGSANKSYLYQQTKALLNKPRLMKFIDEKIKTLGTAACPPYHLALVIGGLSAELTMKIVKLASCKYLDDLPTSGMQKKKVSKTHKNKLWIEIIYF